jgi:uncharacterized membrane protein YdbT with pleckstrin-like domain
MGYVESLLSKEEHIAVRTRQHWVALLASALINGFVVIVTLVLRAALGTVAQNLQNVAGPLTTVLNIATVLGVGFGLVRFGWDLLQWSAEEYIVTNRRVIQTEGIVNKHTLDSSLEKVNDVKLDQSFFGRLLGYGNLTIVTGSDVGVNKLVRIKDPVQFKTAMLDQKVKLGAEYGEERLLNVEAADRDVPKLIAELDGLRKQGLITDAEFNQKKAKLLKQI